MEKLGENLGANIYILRNREGLSQEDLGLEIGVSRQMVSKWELGLAKPRTGNVQKLCKVFKVSMDQLSGKEAVLEQNDFQKIIDQIKKENIIDTDKLREDLNIVEDIQKEVEKISTENRKKRRKREKKIFLFTLLGIFLLYIAYSGYKFKILTDINNKIAQYADADNYYCEIMIFEETKKKEHIYIWRKGDKYKVETYSYNSVGHEIMHDVKWIDKDNSIYVRYDYINKKLTEYDTIVTNSNIEQVNSIYGSFPDIIRNQIEQIFKDVFVLNKVYKSYYKNYMDLHINDSIIQINNETYLPNSYVRKENNITKRTYYNIKLNDVNEDDVTFKEESIK